MITYLIKLLFYYLFCCSNPQRAVADPQQDQPFQDALDLVIERQASNNTPILHTDAISFNSQYTNCKPTTCWYA